MWEPQACALSRTLLLKGPHLRPKQMVAAAFEIGAGCLASFCRWRLGRSELRGRVSAGV